MMMSRASATSPTARKPWRRSGSRAQATAVRIARPANAVSRASASTTRRFDTAGRIAYTTIFQGHVICARGWLPDKSTAAAGNLKRRRDLAAVRIYQRGIDLGYLEL